MAIDVEALLAPVSEESPAGPDRQYSEERVQIEQYFEESVDQAAPEDTKGGPTNRAERLDSRTLVGLIVDELKLTKDLELGVYLARAGVAAASLDITSAGVAVTAGLLDRFWDTLHPDLETSEVMGRRNICQILGLYPLFVRPLEQLQAIRHDRLGEISLANLVELASDGPGNEKFGLFRAIIHGDAEHNVTGVGEEAVSAAVADITRLSESLTAIEAVFSARDSSVDMRQTQALLKAALRGLDLISGGAGGDAAAAQGASPAPETADSLPTVAPSPGYTGAIKSRQDVLAAIDAICQYYDRHEPASPVPLALKRAKGWVKMSFLDILKDIAPNSMDDAEKVLVQRPSDSD